MGGTVYLPTWMLDFYGKLYSRYIIYSPMDHMGKEEVDMVWLCFFGFGFFWNSSPHQWLEISWFLGWSIYLPKLGSLRGKLVGKYTNPIECLEMRKVGKVTSGWSEAKGIKVVTMKLFVCQTVWEVYCVLNCYLFFTLIRHTTSLFVVYRVNFHMNWIVQTNRSKNWNKKNAQNHAYKPRAQPWPLFLKVNPSKQGLFQAKQGSWLGSRNTTYL